MGFLGRTSVKVENKIFDLSRWGRWDKSEEILVVERSNGKVFKATTSAGGGRWMGKFLCECSVGNEALLRYADEWVSIVGIPRRNRMGAYAEFSFFKRSNGKRRIICIPEGIDAEGWAQAGIELLSLFDIMVDKEVSLNPVKNQKMGCERDHGKKRVNLVKGAELVKSKRGKEREDKIPKFIIESTGGILNQSWWSTVVICTPEVQRHDRRLVSKELIRRFGEGYLTVLESGEALLFMNDSESATKLANVGSIRVEEGMLSFRRWSPDFNALPAGFVKPSFIWLEMSGFPMHLKKEEIVVVIVKNWGGLIEVDQQSMAMSSHLVRVKLLNPKWNLIPRLIHLEEKGCTFPVIVDVCFAKPAVPSIPVRSVVVSDDSVEEKKVFSSGNVIKISEESNVRWEGGSLPQWREGPADNSSFIQNGDHMSSRDMVEARKIFETGMQLKESYADVLRKKKGKVVAIDQGEVLMCSNGFTPLEDADEESIPQNNLDDTAHRPQAQEKCFNQILSDDSFLREPWSNTLKVVMQ